MTEITDIIQALTSDQAARVLALTVDHADPLPDPAQLRTLDSGLRDALTDDAELTEYASPAGQAADPGELAKATPLYLAATRPDLVPVITPDSGDRYSEMILPFSKEAESLSFDIELIQFLAQRVVIHRAKPLRP